MRSISTLTVVSSVASSAVLLVRRAVTRAVTLTGPGDLIGLLVATKLQPSFGFSVAGAKLEPGNLTSTRCTVNSLKTTLPVAVNTTPCEARPDTLPPVGLARLTLRYGYGYGGSAGGPGSPVPRGGKKITPGSGTGPCAISSTRAAESSLVLTSAMSIVLSKFRNR